MQYIQLLSHAKYDAISGQIKNPLFPRNFRSLDESLESTTVLNLQGALIYLFISFLFYCNNMSSLPPPACY